MHIQLEKLTALELGHLVNSRRVTPTQVVDYFLARIEEKNPEINAITYTMPDSAHRRAKYLEEQLLHQPSIGPFAGVPFALKDFLPSKRGWLNSHGGVKSLIREDEYDSVFCQAMEDMGGIALGKTNAPAYGFRGTTDNKLYGPTRNPFNTKYNSGGSSGGSAAAVAAGLVLIAEGGDAGGSIRVPAAWCNCYGFKASFGSIPNVCRPDAWAASHPYCTPGGLTKSVADSAILLNEMSRYDARDPMSAFFTRPNYAHGIFPNWYNINPKSFQVAYTYDFDVFPLDDEIKERFTEFLEFLRSIGIQPVEVHFDFRAKLKELSDAWCTGICIDSAIEYTHGINIPDDPRDLPDEFIYWNDRTANVRLTDYYKFHRVRTQVYDEIQNVFDVYNVLVSPVTCCLPVPNAKDGNTVGPATIGGEPCPALIGFAETFLYNFTGNPAASIPFGLSTDNLPVGVQVAGKRYNDEVVLQFSKLVETHKPWKQLYKL